MAMLATIALVAAAAVAAQDASPAFLFSLEPANNARGLEARQARCPSGYGQCRGYNTCAPFDAQCCNGGSYCKAGTRCVVGGCCPNGKICGSGGGGTITEDGGSYTDYTTSTSTTEWTETSTSTGSASTSTSSGDEIRYGDTRPFTPYGSPRVVKVSSTVTTYYEVDLYYEVTYTGTWVETKGCLPVVKRSNGVGNKMSIEFDSSVVGFSLSCGIMGTGDIVVWAGGVAQNISILDASTVDDTCKFNYWFEFQSGSTSTNTMTIEYFYRSYSMSSSTYVDDYINVNQVRAYADRAQLHSASTTSPYQSPSTSGAQGTGDMGATAARTTGRGNLTYPTYGATAGGAGSTGGSGGGVGGMGGPGGAAANSSGLRKAVVTHVSAGLIVVAALIAIGA